MILHVVVDNLTIVELRYNRYSLREHRRTTNPAQNHYSARRSSLEGRSMSQPVYAPELCDRPLGVFRRSGS